MITFDTRLSELRAACARRDADAVARLLISAYANKEPKFHVLEAYATRFDPHALTAKRVYRCMAPRRGAEGFTSKRNTVWAALARYHDALQDAESQREPWSWANEPCPVDILDLFEPTHWYEVWPNLGVRLTVDVEATLDALLGADRLGVTGFARGRSLARLLFGPKAADLRCFVVATEWGRMYDVSWSTGPYLTGLLRYTMPRPVESRSTARDVLDDLHRFARTAIQNSTRQGTR